MVKPELWSSLQRIPGTDECVLWNGCRMRGPRPYGQVRHEGKTQYVHRLSFLFHKGPIPAGMEVCHTCDNPPCFNPRHLFAGTRKDNMQDSVAKGRNFLPQGVLHPKVRLTEQQVLEIRSLYKPHTRGFGWRSLSYRYGVHEGTIRAIIERRSWRHL